MTNRIELTFAGPRATARKAVEAAAAANAPGWTIRANDRLSGWVDDAGRLVTEPSWTLILVLAPPTGGIEDAVLRAILETGETEVLGETWGGSPSYQAWTARLHDGAILYGRLGE